MARPVLCVSEHGGAPLSQETLRQRSVAPGDGHLNGGLEPRLVGPAEAALRHPFLVALPIVVLVAVALALGLSRDPVYTSHARLTVGRVNVPAYSLQNAIQGNATLAVSFARAIDAPAVVAPAARRVKVDTATARGRLDATPLPGSTLIRVDADGPSRHDAIALANAASASLRKYVVRLNRTSGTNEVLRSYRAAQTKLQRAARRARTFGDSERPAALRARVALRTAQLRAASIEVQYRSVLADQAPRNPIQVLTPATSATSDRNDRLQQMLILAGVGGLVLGLALALLASNRE